MAGVIVDLRVKEGSIIKIGDPIAVMSAMKMETVINSSCDGVVESVHAKPNDSLNAGDMIAKIKSTES
jgi:pyruvate carboxylase